MRQLNTFLDAELPEMDPVISCEEMGYGWRGLTLDGEILEVKSTNGHKAQIPGEIIIGCDGRPVGKRRVTDDMRIDIDDYLLHFNRVVELYKNNEFDKALVEANLTMKAAPTLRAKFNRSMILLASGKWREGLHQYWECEQSKPFMRPNVEQALAAGLKPWVGEPLNNKRLLLLHSHGFGDTIMTLRYVYALGGAVMVMPPELDSLARQCGTVVNQMVDADFFCPMLHLIYFLNIKPSTVEGKPYLALPQQSLMQRWHNILPTRKKKIGVAWSIGKPSPGDYPREIDLERLVEHFKDAELHSVQTQGAMQAEELGVITHEFANFADCASLMGQMDEIVSVDTAALHLAGAIGHRKVTALLSYWSSWRWIAPWYDNVRLVKQTSPDNWESALAQLK